MRLSRNKLIAIGTIILYIAFFTNPPPSHVQNLLESSFGHIAILLGIFYVAAYQSLLVSVFLGIAYIMTARNVTEYLDEKEQAPPKEETITAEGVPDPAMPDALQNLLNKKEPLSMPMPIKTESKNKVNPRLEEGKNKLNKIGDTVKHTAGDTRLPQQQGNSVNRPVKETTNFTPSSMKKQQFTEQFSPF